MDSDTDVVGLVSRCAVIIPEEQLYRIRSDADNLFIIRRINYVIQTGTGNLLEGKGAG